MLEKFPETTYTVTATVAAGETDTIIAGTTVYKHLIHSVELNTGNAADPPATVFQIGGSDILKAPGTTYSLVKGGPYASQGGDAVTVVGASDGSVDTARYVVTYSILANDPT